MNPPLLIRDARLLHLFLRSPQKAASVEEYAHAAGMTVDEVLGHLAPLFAQGTLSLDAVDGVLFVNTSPSGRPTPPGKVDVAPNLWEVLSARAPAGRAVDLWRLVRGLESGGWRVEVDHATLQSTTRVPRELLHLGVYVKNNLFPVVPYPDPLTLGSRVLTPATIHGATSLAITCPPRQLETAVTATRSWFLAAQKPPELTVLVLEAPSFPATLVRTTDNSVTPVTVQRFDPTSGM